MRNNHGAFTVGHSDGSGGVEPSSAACGVSGMDGPAGGSDRSRLSCSGMALVGFCVSEVQVSQART